MVLDYEGCKEMGSKIDISLVDSSHFGRGFTTKGGGVTWRSGVGESLKSKRVTKLGQKAKIVGFN